MPTYEYYCETCNKRFDAFQKFSDAPLDACPEGHAPVRRVFSPAGIIFKGSGWYSTDSKASASTTSSNDTKSSNSTTTEAKSDATKETTPAPAPTPSSSDAKSEAA